jgi:hypothetical protein
MRLMFVTLIAAELACAGTSAQRTPSNGSTQRPSADRPASAVPSTVNPDPATSTVIAAFNDRIKAYVELRSKVDDGIPKLTETSDPKKIADRERALGEALIKARMNAKPGDVFAPEFQAVLKRIVKEDFAKRTPAERKALIVELPKGVRVGVNQIYPTTIPLATFPPNLLKALPDLPPDLEYRIVFRHLILRDVKANYVVDMLHDVFPIPL